MRLVDYVPIKGILEITGTVAGEIVFHYKDKNTITYNARSMVNYACAGERAIDPIKFIAVGSGGYMPGATNENEDPPAPEPENTALYQEIYRKNIIVPVNHSTILSSIYEIELGPTELTNAKISECGLVTEGNMLFARRTLRPVTKIQNMILNLKWTLLY